MARKEETATDRRTFLKMASVGTLAGGAAAVTGVSAQASEEIQVEGSGYRESEHVKRVYELSRF
ncbi:MAG: twin-arginine translocation signal domain-containing protein [Pseudomonadota bacterium]